MSRHKRRAISVGSVDIGGFRIGLLARVSGNGEAQFFMMDPSGSAMIPVPHESVARYLREGQLHFENDGAEERLRQMLGE